MIRLPNNNIYRTVVAIWLSLSIASVTLAAMNWVQLHRRLKISAQAVAVVDAAEGVLKSMLDMETAQRGFSITGDGAFLAPFKSAEEALPAQLDRVGELARGNPMDLRQMTDLLTQAEVLRTLSKRVIAARREGGLEAAAAIVKVDESREVMDKARRKVDEIRSLRYPLISTEGRSSHHQLLRASLISLIAGAIGIGAGLFAMYLAGISLQPQQRERELLKAKLRAERESEEKSTFLANMSHEIRTPMNAILGFSELLFAELREPKHRQYLHSIRTSAASLLQLINDILDMSKVESGVLELHPEPTDPREIYDFIHTLFSEPARKKGVKLECKIAPDLPQSLLLDRVRLRQILVNLVGNAVKFTDHGCVTTNVTWEKGEESASRITLIIQVIDTGVGIPQDRLDAIFKPFVQAGLNHDKEEMGTGLGLAIVHRLVEAMGGTVTVASTVGKGSTIELRFRAVPVSARLPATDQDDWEDKADFNQLRAAKILVVDDNRQNCDLIAGMFSSTHHQLQFGIDGQDAVEKVATFQPDVLLFDIRMPRMDGRVALERIRRTRGLELLPVIAVSASSLAGEEKGAREVVSGYLRKPFTQRELFNELAQFLPKQQPGKAFEPSVDEPLPAVGVERALIVQLRALEAREWPGLRDGLAVNETRAFAMKLDALAREFGCEPLLSYATALSHYADTYAVDEMESQLQRFPSFIERLGGPAR